MEIQFPKLKGVEFYLCGGAVRDKLLGKESKDLDFVMMTDMSFDEVVEAIEKEGELFVTKPEFLTIRCRLQDQVFDLVFPRGDGSYNDSRHPDKVVRLDSLAKDAERRDFTINAMYMDSEGNIIDPMMGKFDITNRSIITCGNPDDRFREDALRMLRALRFMIQLNFYIDARSARAIHQNTHLLENISVDRIRDEINKMLLMNPFDALDLLNKFGMLPIIKNKGIKFQVTNKKL